MIRKLLLLTFLPYCLSAQDFPDIRIDTTAKRLDFYEGRHHLQQGFSGEHWDLEVNSILRYGTHGDSYPFRPTDEVGRWSVMGDSLILRIERKSKWMLKRKLPYNKRYRMLCLQWNFLADAQDRNPAVPHVAYLTILIDNKLTNVEALTKEFIAFVRNETVDVGIIPSQSLQSSSMVSLVLGLSKEFCGKRGVFLGSKVYRNGELLKDYGR